MFLTQNCSLWKKWRHTISRWFKKNTLSHCRHEYFSSHFASIICIHGIMMMWQTVKLGKSVNNNRIVRSFIKCTELIYSCKRVRHNKFSSPAGRLFTPQSIADNNRSIPSCWPRCDDGWWRDHGALNDQRLINRPRRTGLNVFLRQCVCACVYSCVLDSCVTLMNVWEQIP